MSKAYFLTDKDGNKIYPYGHVDAVFTSDGNKVGDKLDDINTHTEDTDIHITSTERTNWNSSVTNSHTHSNKTVLDGITSALITAWNNAVAHVSDTVKHITSTERTNWGSAYTHSTSAHAPSNAEANQNAFSNVVVGTTTIAANSKTDSLTLVAGSNVTITPDATNDKVTIAATDTTYNPATTSIQGLMSAEDKTKLDGIATGANKTTVDTALSSTSTNPVQNKVINTALSGKASTEVVSTTANGLCPKFGGTTTKFLRDDGTWAVPPENNYTHPTTSGNKHIPSGGAAGQILKYSSDGTAVWGTIESIATTEPTTQSNGDHWLLEY